MHYVLLIAEDESRWTTMPEEAALREMGAYAAYTKALQDEGIYVGGNRLEWSSTATSVRVGADGTTTVLDGPYADTKEQLGGYYIVDVPDLDAAIAWAARCPGASSGTIEVRPIGIAPPPG